MIAVVHGYGDHGGRYAWLGEDMVARGYGLYAYDLRGHGHSSGRRGQVGRFEEYLDDTEVFLGEVRRAQPGKPVFLLGHSMGGLVCARLAEVRPPDVRGLDPLVAVPAAGRGHTAVPRYRPPRRWGKVWPNRDIGNTVRAEATLARQGGGRCVHDRSPRTPRGPGALGGRDAHGAGRDDGRLGAGHAAAPGAVRHRGQGGGRRLHRGAVRACAGRGQEHPPGTRVSTTSASTRRAASRSSTTSRPGSQRGSRPPAELLGGAG